MRLGCQCEQMAGYILPVMTRRGLRGIVSRGSLGQLEVPPAYLASPAVQGQYEANYALPGVVNAQGQTMADWLVAGNDPGAFVPANVFSPAAQMAGNITGPPPPEAVNALLTANMPTNDAGTAYSWASSFVPNVSLPSFSIPWWVWAIGGAVGIVVLADVVKK